MHSFKINFRLSIIGYLILIQIVIFVNKKKLNIGFFVSYSNFMEVKENNAIFFRNDKTDYEKLKNYLKISG